jgi:putative lipoprotein
VKKRAFVCLFGLILASCSSAQQPGEVATGWEPDPRPVARTLVYACPDQDGSGYEFTARLGPGEMALWFEDRYLVLSRVRAASGVRYEEADVMFWMKGEEAMLSVGPHQYRDCRLLPARAPWEDARRRGVSFRAVGSEPGWYLELGRERGVLFVGDDGATRLELADPEEESAEGARILQGRVAGTLLRVEIIDGVCTETGQGDPFPSHVTVQVDGDRYQGCGRTLEPWHHAK